MKPKFNIYNFQARIEDKLKSLEAGDIREKQLVNKKNADYSTYYGENIDTQIEHLRKLAAVTGCFKPLELLTSARLEGRLRLLSHFSSDCNIIPGDNVEWILKSDLRSAVLKSLTLQGNIFEYLNNTTKYKDEFGRILFEVLLSPKTVNVDAMDRPELLELSNVLSSIGNTDTPLFLSVKEKLTSITYLDHYYHLPENFIGRETELKLLTLFVNQLNYHGAWSGFLLHGQGGSGKSTLLAKLCRDVISANSAVLCLLDFDRPGIDADDPVWLQNELARQIGQQFPQNAEQIREFRTENLDSHNGSNTSLHLPEHQQSKSASSPVLHLLKTIIESNEKACPLLIILDTMEQVILNQSLNNLIIWLDDLCDVLNPIPIKVILSGRVYDNIRSKNIETTVNLGNFDRKTAIEFLSREGHSRKDIVKLFQFNIIPYRPLDLRLISRIIRQGQCDMTELADDIRTANPDGLAGEYYAGIIYRRILGRIEHPLVKKIAYPGLILRYIDPEIVTEILQPILKLNFTGSEHAASIVKELEKYAWLAHRDHSGKVWHRRDLRQIMIHQMMQNETEQVKAIQQAAIAYFTSRGTDQDFAEAIYHKMMMDNGVLEFIPEPGELKSAIDYFRRDITDLPKEYDMMIRYANEAELEVSDMKALPEKYFRLTYDETGRRMVSKNLLQDAYEVYQLGLNTAYVRIRKLHSFLDQWEMEMLFNLGRIDELSVLINYHFQEEEQLTSAMQLCNYLFPAAIVSPEKIDRKLLFTAMQYIGKEDGISYSAAFNGQDGLSMINRLALSLVMLNRHAPFTDEERVHINMLYTIGKGSITTVMAEKSLMLLSLLSKRGYPEIYRYGTETICLSALWIKQIIYNDTIMELAGKGIERVVNILEESLVRGMPARQLLNSVDSERETKGLGILNLSAKKIKSSEQRIIYLNGPDILLRSSCKHAIYLAIEDGLPPALLRNTAEALIMMPIADLEKEMFKRRKRDAVDWLDAILDLIDRKWELKNFMSKLCQEWPLTDQMHQVKAILEDFELACIDIMNE